MFKKSTILFASSAFAASALIPVAAFAVEATAISHYVIEKNGKFYSLDAEAYKEMKAAGVHQSGSLSGTSITYVKSGDGKVYDLNFFLEAKASVSNGTMKDALTILKNAGAEETGLAVGDVTIGTDGSITLQESGSTPTAPVEEGELEVIGIE